MSLENEELELPRKRLKTSKKREENVVKSENRRLFAPFRALGFVTNHVPFALQVRSYKGATGPPRVHILTCLGRAWAEFEGEKMKLLFVGPNIDVPITSMTLSGNSVWVTAGTEIIQYETGKEVSRFSSPLDITLSSILIFGSQVIALTEDGRYMFVWDTQSEELETTIVFDGTFTAKYLIHPATLLNKVLVASAEGTMELWNIRTRTRIHTFLFSNRDADFSIKSPITSLTESHVTDVVGIGFSSGDVLIHDIRTDEVLLRVRMEGGAITAIAFRTDGQEVLATSNSTGHIAFWDLNNKGRLLHVTRGAHDAAISSIQWIPKQPVLVSSGHDNSVKQWIFDSLDLPPRLLKYRSGHYSPPHLIRFYGDDGKQLLSASQDRSLRCTSVVRDSRNFELSQGSLTKKATSLSIPLASLKFPPITAMSFSTSRSKEWDDVLTSHMDDTFARSWSVHNKRNGSFTFNLVDDKAKSAANQIPGVVKAVHVTACGNFGLAGSSTGVIQLWSMQSGLKRKTFELGPAPEEVDFRFRPTNGKASKSSPGRSVTGLETDALNKTLVVGTLDGTLNFFNFHTKVLDETLVLPSSIVSIRLQRESNLLAVICDDMTVRIFDLETKRLVRELTGFKGRVLDISFSHDSRWLITTSLDSIIRTFDIPTGQLIDAFRTSSVATSISFSPTGDFLASAHVDALGIYLWANRAQYAEVSWRPSSEVEIEASGDVSLPSIQGSAEEEALQGLASIGAIESPNVFSTPPQLDGELITITLLPRARWQTLLHLDVIAKRNKPKEPPKAPEKAPFFLPSLSGETIQFDLEGATDKMSLETGQAREKKTRRLEKDRTMETLSEFQRILTEEDPDGDYENLFLFLKTLTPAATDLELRLLVTIHYALFLRAITNRLTSHKDFEMVQTLLSVFIRLHGENLVENAELRQSMDSLLRVLKKETERLRNLVTKSIGALGFIREVG